MLLKVGVDISRLNRDIRRAMHKLAVFWSARGYELIVTSTYEGNHSAGSLHYANDAIDVRIPPFITANVIEEDITDLLGDEFDIVWENDHIHIEYDPK